MNTRLASILVSTVCLAVGGVESATAALGGASSSVVVKAAYNKTLKATILVDGAGRTLYLLTSDPRNVSTCASLGPSCPGSWPALKPPARAGAGVKAALLATTKNGKQVTYNGHPLYHYRGDKRAGDLNGQGFFQIWYVVSPKGAPIKK
jgi:predicted lipoprotein with Yx(FWY)xxD motif